MTIKKATVLLFFAVTILGAATSSNASPWPGHLFPNDFDGDKISDLCIWRPSTGEWYCVPSSGNVIPGWTPVGAGPGSVVQWGLPGDILVPGDYDNDGKTDPAVVRPGFMNWYIRYSSGGTAVIQFGLNGDILKTGPIGPISSGSSRALYRPSNDRVYCPTVSWSAANISTPGTHGAFPFSLAAGAIWNTKHSGNKFRVSFINCTTGFGNQVDYFPLSHSGKMTTGLYLLGDLTYDIVHFLNNVWTIYPGGQGAVTPTVVTWGWGLSNDVPVKGDFDGDTMGDLTVYNNGTWRVFSSGSFYGSPPPHLVPYGSNPGDYWLQWGLPGDIPIE